MARIYLSPPHMGRDERGLLLDAFDSNWIAPVGPHVDAFERELAARVGVGHAAALSSGTAALHLALRLIGVCEGDEVLTSTFTFAATVNAIRYVGAAPVFVDSDRRTWNMDPQLLAEELEDCARRGRLPRAVVVVDLYGQCADYDPILECCARYDVPVIEDAAEALGASYRDRPAGSLGAMGVFSFNGNKIITTGGGGMLVSNRPEWIDRARYLSAQARDPAPHYRHTTVGFNYRLCNLLAALGRGQLRVLDRRIEARRANNAFYRRELSDLPGVGFMPEAAYGRATCWLTCITVDPVAFGADREAIRLHLERRDIEARPVWLPMHLQPAHRDFRSRGGSVSAGLFEQGLCLPSGSSLDGADRDRIVEAIRSVPGLTAEATSMKVRSVPEVDEILSGTVATSKFRDVVVEDLLRRDPVELDADLIEQFIAGKVVLVTGAGGSIGAEICRQVCRFEPSSLVLLDQAENPLFHTQRELTEEFAGTALVSRVGSVTEGSRMRQVLAEVRPEVIFHAAAHKHVPLMEANPAEAIRNNVGGSRIMADLADEFHADAFVMISTDKAVNPTSVMGATKRLAEVYVQALASRSKTRFMTVRFGNVLGSEGSVVPLFLKEIARGGPVRVTHPDMKRYFMTIPEAGQLVLQAAAMGDGGEIFVLEMGQPIRIVDLARDLIRLSGFDAEGDIEIVFTGIRPGEKLSEEIDLSEENATKTRHPRIWIGESRGTDLERASRAVDGLLERANDAEPEGLREGLAALIPEYTPYSLDGQKGRL